MDEERYGRSDYHKKPKKSKKVIFLTFAKNLKEFCIEFFLSLVPLFIVIFIVLYFFNY